MKFIITKKKADALKTLTMTGHSKEFVVALPQQLADAYFTFQHLPHYIISSTSLIQNMIPEITESELAYVQKPTALILGTNDNFLPQERGKQLVAAIRDGTFYSIQDSGHLP